MTEGADTDVGFPEKNKHRFQMEFRDLDNGYYIKGGVLEWLKKKKTKKKLSL